MGFNPRVCLFLLLAVSLISYCYAENEKVLLREGSQDRVIGPEEGLNYLDGGIGVRGTNRRSLKVNNGGGEISAEVEDYQDPSANPKHNPPPPP